MWYSAHSAQFIEVHPVFLIGPVDIREEGHTGSVTVRNCILDLLLQRRHIANTSGAYSVVAGYQFMVAGTRLERARHLLGCHGPRLLNADARGRTSSGTHPNTTAGHDPTPTQAHTVPHQPHGTVHTHVSNRPFLTCTNHLYTFAYLLCG